MTADDKTDKVDKLFAKWDTTVSPGAALAIIKDGKIIYRRGYGMANLEHNVPITSSSVFRIGSTSKQFTASCIALLSLQGKISLDDNVRKYIPELPKFEKPITIRNLVHHTSGIRDYLTLAGIAALPEDYFYTPDDTVKLLSRQKRLNFPPGEQNLYSNSGYFLMGVTVQRASGKSLRDFAQKYIFEPLGMKNTHYHDDHTLIVKNRAAGYSPTKDGFRIDMTTLDHVGDGGVFTTVEDIYLWDQAFYNYKLGKEFIDLIQIPGLLNNGEKLDYAFGLGIDEYRGLRRVSHGGGFAGFRAQLARFPEQKFSVICLANLGTINPSRLCMQIADIYLAGEFGEPPTRETRRPEEKASSEEIALKPAQLNEYAGEYHNDELPVTYKLVVEKGSLFFRHKNAPKDALKAMSLDKFTLRRMNIEFTRDKRKRITGFELGAGRAARIEFVKK